MKKVLIIFALLSSGCVSNWTYKDTLLQTLVTGSILYDKGQTERFLKNSDSHETNKFLGKYPSQRKIDNYFTLCVIGNAFISAQLEPANRHIWQGGSLMFQGYYINHNYKTK